MSDVTQLLNAIDAGDPQAADQLLPLVYEELRKLAAARMAQQSPGQTLQATALVHEAYVRLTGGTRDQWNGRAHFFRAAAEAMRCILIENARSKSRWKRGGRLERVELEGLELAADALRTPNLPRDWTVNLLAFTSSCHQRAKESPVQQRCLNSGATPRSVERGMSFKS